MRKTLLAAIAFCLLGGQAQALEHEGNPFSREPSVVYQMMLERNNPDITNVVSQWPTNVLKSYLWRADQYAWRIGDSIAYYGKASPDAPGEVIIFGKYDSPRGQISFSDDLSEKTKEEQDEIWKSYKVDLMKRGYERIEMLRFSEHPVKLAGFDSTILYPQEQSEVYEMYFSKKIGTIKREYQMGKSTSVRYIPIYANVIISRMPELRDGNLSYSLISAYYARD